MNSNLILKSDVLDIIFEKRNKAYGAYTLRKLYPNRLKFALGIMLIIASAFSVLTLLPPSKEGVLSKVYAFDDPEFTNVETEKVPPPQKEIPPPAEIEHAVPPAPVNTMTFISSIKMVDDPIATEPLKTLGENVSIGSTTVENGQSGPPTVQPVKTETGIGTEPVKIDKTVTYDLAAVDIPPSFPGGTEALMNFLRKHLNNPEPMADGEYISVKVTFVVGLDGKLQSFKIIQDGGDIFNKEVIRVLKKMPDWVPGKAKGENVSVYYTIPVKFTGTD